MQSAVTWKLPVVYSESPKEPFEKAHWKHILAKSLCVIAAESSRTKEYEFNIWLIPARSMLPNTAPCERMNNELYRNIMTAALWLWQWINHQGLTFPKEPCPRTLSSSKSSVLTLSSPCFSTNCATLTSCSFSCKKQPSQPQTTSEFVTIQKSHYHHTITTMIHFCCQQWQSNFNLSPWRNRCKTIQKRKMTKAHNTCDCMLLCGHKVSPTKNSGRTTGGGSSRLQTADCYLASGGRIGENGVAMHRPP